MRYTVERVTVTRRRGDAEEDAENTFEGSKAERTQRKRREVGWRHRPCAQVVAGRSPQSKQTQFSMVTYASLRSRRISADSALSGFDFLISVLRVFLRVSRAGRSGMRRRLHRDDRGAAQMRYTVERVTVTRRRGDAEEDAENTFEGSKAERTQRKRREVGWRHRPCAQVVAGRSPQSKQTQFSMVTYASLRSRRISADSALSGFDFLISVLRVFLRVSASPRQDHCRCGCGFAKLGAMP